MQDVAFSANGAPGAEVVVSPNEQRQYLRQSLLLGSPKALVLALKSAKKGLKFNNPSGYEFQKGRPSLP